MQLSLRAFCLFLPTIGLAPAAPVLQHVEVLHYLVEIESATTVIAPDGAHADTATTRAVVTLTITDSVGGRIADFRLDSVWDKHQIGPRASARLKFDPVASGFTLSRFIYAGAPARQRSMSPLNPDAISVARAPMIRALAEFFPLIRGDVPVGGGWGDSTSGGGYWKVVSTSNGALELANVQNIEINADVEGGHVATHVKLRRDLVSTVTGPVLRSTIVENLRSQIDDPAEDLHFNTVGQTTTRIVRVP
ncbi:MAG: hypothetical protein ABIZ70_10895 [Gemmatimonadales bacterium]